MGHLNLATRSILVHHNKGFQKLDHQTMEGLIRLWPSDCMKAVFGGGHPMGINNTMAHRIMDILFFPNEQKSDVRPGVQRGFTSFSVMIASYLTTAEDFPMTYMPIKKIPAVMKRSEVPFYFPLFFPTRQRLAYLAHIKEGPAYIQGAHNCAIYLTQDILKWIETRKQIGPDRTKLCARKNSRPKMKPPQFTPEKKRGRPRKGTKD